MIKKFLQCRNIDERVKFLADTVISDWSEQDLTIVINTMGSKEDGLKDKAAKLTAIGKHLADYKHEVELKNEMDCSELDNTTFVETADTLFEPESVIEVINTALKKDE